MVGGFKQHQIEETGRKIWKTPMIHSLRPSTLCRSYPCNLEFLMVPDLTRITSTPGVVHFTALWQTPHGNLGGLVLELAQEHKTANRSIQRYRRTNFWRHTGHFFSDTEHCKETSQNPSYSSASEGAVVTNDLKGLQSKSLGIPRNTAEAYMRTILKIWKASCNKDEKITIQRGIHKFYQHKYFF